MKKTQTNNRSAISKITARMMLIIFILTSALSFSACGEPNCKEGQHFNCANTMPPAYIDLKAITDVQVFPCDDVTFDMCIGLNNRRTLREFYTIDEYETPTWPYYSENWYYVLYAVHLLDYENWAANIDGDNMNSQENIDASFLNKAYVLKEIPRREAVESREYYFTELWEGAYFNHCEEITIPKEVFLDDVSPYDECVYIGMCLVDKSSETGKYISIPYNDISMFFRYAVADDTVELVFPYVNN